jgi:hypothetical protein
MVPIRLLENGVVLGDRVYKRGELAEAPASLAEKLVAAGRASYTVKVKALQPHTVIGSRVCSAGEELEVSGDMAVALSNRGAVEIASPAALASTLRDRLVKWIAPLIPKRPGPYDGEKKTKVKVIGRKGAFLVDQHYPAGATPKVPLSVAARAVADRAAEYVGEPPAVLLTRPAPIELTRPPEAAP